MLKTVLNPCQLKLKTRLEQMAVELESQSNNNLFKKLFVAPQPIKSLYIYSDVGRGKTMLMNDFFKKITKTKKINFHFNSFMRLLHEALRDIYQEQKQQQKTYQDQLIAALKKVIKDKKLICFDEFQVTDIADAMLLSRIFSYIFANDIVVVFTSNLKPLDLYQNGLQREIFLEFIKNILLKNCEIWHLEGEVDYRLQFKNDLNLLNKRYFIANKKNREIVVEIIKKLTGANKLKPKVLKVWGREVKLKKTYQKIASINFKDLCCTNLAAADYQTICQNFNLIFLFNLPKLTYENINEAKRFMLFIDEVYENKVALIILAKAKINEIYQNDNDIVAQAFKRTKSRLNEIKSDNYWQNSKFASGIFN